MSDLRRKKLADVLVNYSVAVKPGDWVVILANIIAEPLVDEIVAKVMEAGGYPDAVFSSTQVRETKLYLASEAQLKWISPFFRHAVEKADALISLWGEPNTRALAGIDPAKLRMQSQAEGELMQVFMQRAAAGELRWVGSQFPCQANAQDADMSLREYENFVYGATFADQEDPVARWQQVEAEQARLVEWLDGKQQVQVRGPHVDLNLSIAGRTFINSAGKENMPCGEIFTSPVEDSANGWIEFTYPAITDGREVDGIRLEFKAGEVVQASAEKDEAYLLEMLEADPGARRLGEFAVGTNYGIQRFTKNILFDEKIGGTIHLALGRGFPESGSQNESSLHWDMICDMHNDSEIWVDGELFYKDGQFQV